jgi:GH35 family endo-1,4-beta-xylanase
MITNQISYTIFFLVTAMLLVQTKLNAEDQMQVPDATFYGINEDPVWNFKAKDTNTDELSQFAEMLKQTHCGAIRIPIRWRIVEPTKGNWDFSAIDRVVNMIPDDIQILATLMSIPEWANGMNPAKTEGWFDVYPPKDISDWEHYVSQTVQKYKHRIKHWEIWNEENGVDFYRPLPEAKAYTELLKVAYKSAKTADPDCVVVLGGLQMNGIIPNPWSNVKTSNYLEDLYKAGAKQFFDVCNIHPYALPSEGADYMMKMTKDTLSLMSQYGDSEKPLWITEVGCGATSQDAEEIQAKLLAYTFEAASKEPQIKRVFWFLLRDMQNDLLGPEGSMGLFSYQGRPKPAFQAFLSAAEKAHNAKSQ